MQLANEVGIASVFALGKEIKPEPVLEICGESPAVVYALGDNTCLPSGTSIHLNVKVSRGGRVHLATVQDHRKRIERKPDLTKDNPEFATFACSAHLFSCYAHGIRTQFPQNSFRIFLLDADGSWQMEEFSIVAQNRRAFLAHHLIYHGQAYQAADGTVSEPTFPDWAYLQEMIRENVESSELPFLAEAVVPQEAVFGTPTAEKGIVKFFSFATGWGSIFVVTDDGKPAEARALWKHITDVGRPLAYLAHGEEVICNLVTPDPNAEKKTTFKYEAISIRPCG